MCIQVVTEAVMMKVARVKNISVPLSNHAVSTEEFDNYVKDRQRWVSCRLSRTKPTPWWLRFTNQARPS